MTSVAVVRQTSPDSTSTVSFYCVLPINGADVTSNTAGCATPTAAEVPADAASFVQFEPHNASNVKGGAVGAVTYQDAWAASLRVGHARL